MGLDQQRLEEPLIGLDLPLKLFVFLRPEARLPLVGEHVVQIDLRRVGAKDRPAEPSLLQADDLAALARRSDLVNLS